MSRLKGREDIGDAVCIEAPIDAYIAEMPTKSIKTLSSVVHNVMKDPTNEKYRQLRLSNPKVKETITDVQPAMQTLRSLGFTTFNDGGDDFIILTGELDMFDMRKVCYKLDEAMCKEAPRKQSRIPNQNRSKTTKSAHPSQMTRPVVPTSPKRSKTRPTMDFIPNQIPKMTIGRTANRKSKEAMADIIAARLDGHHVQARGSTQQKHAGYFNAGGWNQIQKMHQQQKNKWRDTKEKRTFTLDDVNKLTEERARASLGGLSYDSDVIGKKALQLTNEYRKSKGLPPCLWDGGIAIISEKHSVDMAEGKVPFGHQGFNARVDKFPFVTRTAAENVAMNQGHGDPATCAVEGWIKSKGHEKNLRSRNDLCGIGVYRNAQGAYYLTQMFASKS
eukprot:TRINITY_DN15856_c0_g4_i1.p1 TRINITY_DN15856_c0_g4~~TRINITY_DN15856_c0_g4_i1.p1  ORF type:complete len:389 (-),score=85.10 TRINITY_DN15856_c0_g4_i1:248-1414(-)